MKKQHACIIVLLWAALIAFAWFSPAKEMSDSERRPLKQFPQITAQKVFNGSFMSDFEDYSLDQFPLRDGFRTIKSLFHTSVLQQKDNNGIYLSNGYAVKQEYPLNLDSIDYALKKFNAIYETYLQDSQVFMAVIPDKGYYLAEEAGQLAMDYEALFAMVEEGMPWAEHIDLTDSLSLTDYYHTDTHWRQEKLLATAGKLCDALGVSSPKAEDYRITPVDKPFYGVYYGQTALPMMAESLYLMESDLLQNCSVYDHETGKTSSVYDFSKLDSRDLYDVYLSGARALLTVDNPQGQPGKELIVFRDSFGSSIVPLLVQDYARVTLVDIRYISSSLLDQFIAFSGQDVLMLYSTLILNSSSVLK